MKKINVEELHKVFEDLRIGDKDAYANLYKNYYNLVYGIVFSIMKNKENSEDITHEIFTKIYKMDSKKLPTTGEASWLYMVSKNECLSYFRKSKPGVSIDEIYEIPSTENEIDNIVDAEFFNEVVSKLKEDDRIIVSLKILSDFSFKKISQVMGIPIGTVQWRYYKAINSLKISLGSLVGAIIAFVFVCASGDWWRKERIFSEIDDNRLGEDKANKGEENIINGQELNEDKTDQTMDNVINTETESEYSNIDSKDSIKRDSEGYQTTKQEYENRIVPEVKIKTIQIACVTLGMVLLIVSIIFFKKYQQKLKRKSSK